MITSEKGRASLSYITTTSKLNEAIIWAPRQQLGFSVLLQDEKENLPVNPKATLHNLKHRFIGFSPLGYEEEGDRRNWRKMEPTWIATHVLGSRIVEGVSKSGKLLNKRYYAMSSSFARNLKCQQVVSPAIDIKRSRRRKTGARFYRNASHKTLMASDAKLMFIPALRLRFLCLHSAWLSAILSPSPWRNNASPPCFSGRGNLSSLFMVKALKPARRMFFLSQQEAKIIERIGL